MALHCCCFLRKYGSQEVFRLRKTKGFTDPRSRAVRNVISAFTGCRCNDARGIAGKHDIPDDLECPNIAGLTRRKLIEQRMQRSLLARRQLAAVPAGRLMSGLCRRIEYLFTGRGHRHRA